MSAPFSAAHLPPLREIIAAHDLAAKKNLGQHFLLDLNLTRKIARAAGDLGGISVIEIGPGPGGLTRALLETEAREVIAIERDERCVAALASLAEAAGDRFKLMVGDALKIPAHELGQAPRAIIANLPYNIGTALLLDWLATASAFCHMTLMFQLEVAKRLVAAPGDPDYGRLSVLTQWRCRGQIAFDIPARAFTPPPKVDSAVVHLVPRAEAELGIGQAALEKITAAAFGQRRKMLRSSLKPLGGESLCEKAGVKPTDRAEDLSVEDFVRLAREHARRDLAESKSQG